MTASGDIAERTVARNVDARALDPGRGLEGDASEWIGVGIHPPTWECIERLASRLRKALRGCDRRADGSTDWWWTPTRSLLYGSNAFSAGSPEEGLPALRLLREALALGASAMQESGWRTVNSRGGEGWKG